MTNRSSPHILNTSANLLGFAFIVLTTIKGFHLPQAGIIDELVALLVIIFALSSLVSFASMRSEGERISRAYETVADYVFLLGLLILTIVTVLVSVDLLAFGK